MDLRVCGGLFPPGAFLSLRFCSGSGEENTRFLLPKKRMIAARRRNIGASRMSCIYIPGTPLRSEVREERRQTIYMFRDRVVHVFDENHVKRRSYYFFLQRLFFDWWKIPGRF